MKLDFELLRDPVVVDESLKNGAEHLGVSQESVALRVGRRLCTDGAVHAVDLMLGEESLEAGIYVYLRPLFDRRCHRGYQGQRVVAIRIVLDFLTLDTLQSLLHFELEDEARVARLRLLLGLHDLIEEILVVLSGILLLACLELWVALAHQVLENGGPDAILIVFVLGERHGLLLFAHLVMDHFFCQQFLTVLAGEESLCQLLNLTLEALGGEFVAIV